MKLKQLSITILFVLPFAVSCHAGEPKWLSRMREVKLLEHRYADTLRILGAPSDGSSEPELAEYFDASDGRYFVLFASGLCGTADYSGGEPIGWKVPKYTAISISFSPQRKIKATELGLDLRSFKKTEIYDVPGAFSFENEDLGIDFVVKRNGLIEDLGFLPPKAKRHLHC